MKASPKYARIDLDWEESFAMRKGEPQSLINEAMVAAQEMANETGRTIFIYASSGSWLDYARPEAK